MVHLHVWLSFHYSDNGTQWEQIGFDHYVEVIERVGRLYVLVKEGQDVQLGPEVSLARTELLGNRGIDKANYAIERPHLISDDFIEDSLSLLRLPEAALKDRVVLVFNAPFDRLLWQVIGKIIADQDLRIEDILKVSADYVLENRTIYLKFSSAIAKRNSQLLSLKRKIPVVML